MFGGLKIWNGKSKMTTHVLRPERINLEAWSFANEDQAGAKTGRKVSNELAGNLSFDGACDATFGAIAPDGLDVEATDVIVTLPFGLTEDDWEGPLLLVSLEDLVQAQIDDLDSPDGGNSEVEDLIAICDGLVVLAKRLEEAISRNTLKLAVRDRGYAPMW